MPRFQILLLTALVMACFTGLVEACPTCKDGLNEDGGHLIRGYFWSIMFMMSMPFLILSGLSGMFYLDVRKARKRQTDQVEAMDAP